MHSLRASSAFDLKGERLSVQSARPARQRRKFGRLTNTALLIAGCACVVLTLQLALVLRDLPPLTLPKTAARTTITLKAADGSLLAETGDPRGDELTATGLPPVLVAAVLSIEDHRFFQHGAIDAVGLVRAGWQNLRVGGVEQGGSTITQQLAKILFLSPGRTLKRKVLELVLASQLENRFSKADILALYLNRAYFGEGAVGVDAAARRYFGCPAGDLRPSQAAVLAAALKAPSHYNLVADREATIARARLVLSNMVEIGYLTAADGARAAEELAGLQIKPKPPSGGYFVDWVVEQVRGMPETWGRPVTVLTTLDPRLQQIAEAKVEAALAANGNKDRIGQTAVVVMTPEGAVKAMVGGRNYGESPFNRAVQARRQPGSTFKTFVYLAAMEHGASPEDKILDAPVTIGDWSPDNYSGKYRGEVTLRRAFAESLNAPAVRTAERISIGSVAATARRFGIGSPLRTDATLALGTSEVGVLEMTGSIAMIASGGVQPDVHGIAEISDSFGKTLYRHQADPSVQATDVMAIAKMQDMMAEVMRSGTGKAAALDRPAAGKTGTSQNYRDAWFVGFTGDLVAAVWMGNDDNSPMNKVTGGALPARLWHNVMSAAHQGLASVPLRQPSDLRLAERPVGLFAAPDQIETFLEHLTGG